MVLKLLFVVGLLFSLFDSFPLRAETSSAENGKKTTSAVKESLSDDGNGPNIKLLLHTVPGVPFVGYYMAQEEGYYQKAGLPPVVMEHLTEYSSIEKEFKKRSVQFVAAWLPPAYCYSAVNKNELVLIAQTVQVPMLGVLIRKDLHPGMRTLENTAGHRVGIYFRTMENTKAIRTRLKIEIEPVYFLKNGLILLRRGVVDALCISSYEIPVFHYSRYRDSIHFLPLVDTGMALPEDCLLCTKDFLFQNPEQCRKFVEATYQGWQSALRDRKKALAVLKNYIEAEGDVYDDRILQRELDIFLRSVDIQSEMVNNGRIDKNTFDKMKNVLIESELLKRGDAPEYESFYYPVLHPETFGRIQKEKTTSLKKPVSGPVNTVTEKKEE